MFDNFLEHYIRAGSFSVSVLSIMVCILSIYLTFTIWPTDRRGTTKVLSLAFVFLFLGMSIKNVFLFLSFEGIFIDLTVALPLILLVLIKDVALLVGTSFAICFMLKMILDKYCTVAVVGFILCVVWVEFIYFYIGFGEYHGYFF